MLSEIAFEQIEGNYWYAAYGPFRVVMMKDTGYINATKLCSSGGKEYYRWTQNKASQELVEVVTKKLGMTMAPENTQDVLENSDLTLLLSNHEIPRLLSPIANLFKLRI